MLILLAELSLLSQVGAAIVLIGVLVVIGLIATADDSRKGRR